MLEVFPGVFHWTAFHEPIGRRVSSHYLEPAGVVLDPKEPEEGWDALPGRPDQIVLTSGHHTRDAGDLAHALGIPIRASRQAADYIGSRLTVETFEDGDEVAPGITAIHVGKLSDDEGALHISLEQGALALADGLNSYGGALGFFRDDLLGDHPERVKEGLVDSFRGLLGRDFAHLLFAHGDPVVGRGKTALREFTTEFAQTR